MKDMKDMVNQTMDAAKRYTVTDYGVLKIMLVTLGILIGVSEPRYFKRHKACLAGIFTGSYAWVMYRTFFVHRR